MIRPRIRLFCVKNRRVKYICKYTCYQRYTGLNDTRQDLLLNCFNRAIGLWDQLPDRFYSILFYFWKYRSRTISHLSRYLYRSKETIRIVVRRRLPSLKIEAIIRKTKSFCKRKVKRSVQLFAQFTRVWCVGIKKTA